MLKSLESYLRTIFDARADERSGTPSEHELQLATAVLLVEVMRSDANLEEAEKTVILSALCDKFALSSEESLQLFELAQHRAEQAFDFQHFTSRLNKGYSSGQKVRIVEYLWRVAYADGHLSEHENHLMRKIADLLYISHGDYIAAKERAKAAERPPSRPQ